MNKNESKVQKKGWSWGAGKGFCRGKKKKKKKKRKKEKEMKKKKKKKKEEMEESVGSVVKLVRCSVIAVPLRRAGGGAWTVCK